MGKPQFRSRKFFACDLLTPQGVSERNFVRGGICTLTGTAIVKGQLSDVNKPCVTGQLFRSLIPTFRQRNKKRLAVAFRPLS